MLAVKDISGARRKANPVLTTDNFITTFAGLLTRAGDPVSVVIGIAVVPLGGFDTDAKVQRPQTSTVRNVRIRANFQQLRYDTPVPDSRSNV
jgi:hypothetical protein